MSGELNAFAGTLVCTALKAMPDITPIPEEQPRADAPAPAASTPDVQPPDPPPTAQPETPELPATLELPQEHVPMIEVHSPHEAVHSWKDAFIHIGIIVAGLLIAVGLDQAVEFIHHRYQIAETRQALRIERHVNINHFAMQTEEFYRFVPKLQNDLAIYQFLKAHPHAPPEQWPGKISGYHMMSRYTDAAWRTAQQDNVLVLMPDREVQDDDQLYRLLAGLSDNMAAKEEAFYEMSKIAIQTPEPSQMSPEQIEKEIQGYANVLTLYGRAAIDQRVLSSHYPDFKPATTYADEQQILRMSGGSPQEDIRQMGEMVERLRREDEAAVHDEDR